MRGYGASGLGSGADNGASLTNGGAACGSSSVSSNGAGRGAATRSAGGRKTGSSGPSPLEDDGEATSASMPAPCWPHGPWPLRAGFVPAYPWPCGPWGPWPSPPFAELPRNGNATSSGAKGDVRRPRPPGPIASANKGVTSPPPGSWGPPRPPWVLGAWPVASWAAGSGGAVPFSAPLAPGLQIPASGLEAARRGMRAAAPKQRTPAAAAANGAAEVRGATASKAGSKVGQKNTRGGQQGGQQGRQQGGHPVRHLWLSKKASLSIEIDEASMIIRLVEADLQEQLHEKKLDDGMPPLEEDELLAANPPWISS